MKPTLKIGLTGEHQLVVTKAQTVPALYPAASEFTEMPAVFATGFMVGFLEWACIKLINPHLDYPDEQSVGIHVDFSHQAATPPGLTVTAVATLVAIDGRKLTFDVTAHDGIETIARGQHKRFIIDRKTFVNKVENKLPTQLTGEIS